jgi:hypothetical protein
MAISKQDIQTRSYLIWEKEGRPHGRDKEHWFLAERQLAAQAAAPRAASKPPASAAKPVKSASKGTASKKSKVKAA